MSCVQVDWENREGSAWEAFSEGYGSGFDEGCQALFDQSPDGSLYEDDYEYTAVACQNENFGDGSEASDIPSEVPDEPESAGTEVGELDGCPALFQNQSVYSLNHGEESWTEADCPIGGVATRTDDGRDDGTGSSSSSAGQPRAHRAGETCTAKQADGTPIVIEIDSGKVNCHGAEALWNEYTRRAQTRAWAPVPLSSSKAGRASRRRPLRHQGRAAAAPPIDPEPSTCLTASESAFDTAQNRIPLCGALGRRKPHWEADEVAADDQADEDVGDRNYFELGQTSNQVWVAGAFPLSVSHQTSKFHSPMYAAPFEAPTSSVHMISVVPARMEARYSSSGRSSMPDRSLM